jgi:hypothetical protein
MAGVGVGVEFVEPLPAQPAVVSNATPANIVTLDFVLARIPNLRFRLWF